MLHIQMCICTYIIINTYVYYVCVYIHIHLYIYVHIVSFIVDLCIWQARAYEGVEVSWGFRRTLSEASFGDLGMRGIWVGVVVGCMIKGP